MTKNLKFGDIVCKYTYFDESHYGDTLDQYITDEVHDYEVKVMIEHEITPKVINPIKRGKETFYFDKNVEVLTHYVSELHEKIKEQLHIDLVNKIIKIYINPLYVENISVQEYVLSGIAFMQIAELEGRVPFHASAISYNNQAIVFSAPSGTGKSTQRELWQNNLEGIEVINDDKPMFYEKDNKWVVASFPCSGKSKMSKNITVPLRAIVFLKQANKPKITKLKSVTAMRYMLENTYRPTNKDLYKTLLDHLMSIQRQSDIYFLEATREKETFDLLYHTLFKGELHEN